MRRLVPPRLWSLRPTITRPKSPATVRTMAAASNEGGGNPLLERQILNPRRIEICQSGTDDEVARHKSPYDPSKTTVESAVQALRDEYKLEGDSHDPFLVSPANLQVSQILQRTVGTQIHSAQELRSMKGLTHKNKKVLRLIEPYAFRKYDNVFFDYKKREKVCS